MYMEKLENKKTCVCNFGLPNLCPDLLINTYSIDSDHHVLSTPADDTPVVHTAFIDTELVVIETVGANKKYKVSTKKVLKNKQFTHKFELSEMNYVELLNSFLRYIIYKNTKLL